MGSQPIQTMNSYGLDGRGSFCIKDGEYFFIITSRLDSGVHQTSRRMGTEIYVCDYSSQNMNLIFFVAVNRDGFTSVEL
jgi:hypothetical protein